MLIISYYTLFVNRLEKMIHSISACFYLKAAEIIRSVETAHSEYNFLTLHFAMKNALRVSEYRFFL